jgi:hypothetical protein
MEHRSAWECAQRLIGLSHSNSQWNRKGKVGTLGIGVVRQGSPERPPRHSGRSWVGPSDEAQPYGCRRQPSWVLLLGPDATNPFFNTYIFTENDHRRELAAPAAGIVLEGPSLFRTRKAGEAFVANACGGLCVDMLVGGLPGCPTQIDCRQSAAILHIAAEKNNFAANCKINLLPAFQSLAGLISALKTIKNLSLRPSTPSPAAIICDSHVTASWSGARAL